jgi:DNA repair protein RecO (recombination protein O)
MIRNVRALVLWTKRSRDADKVVGLFTREIGRLTVRATSAARSTAKLGALTEPFVEGEMTVYTGKDQAWGKLVGGQMIRSFPLLRVDMTRVTAAAWMCEIMNRMTPVEQPAPEKYALLSEALEALETATSFEILRLGFAVRFLSYAGFGLDHWEAWQRFGAEHPSRAQDLKEGPLEALGHAAWNDPAVSALTQLAGRMVTDQLDRPLAVNRFRQMTGIEI